MIDNAKRDGDIDLLKMIEKIRVENITIAPVNSNRNANQRPKVAERNSIFE